MGISLAFTSHEYATLGAGTGGSRSAGSGRISRNTPIEWGYFGCLGTTLEPNHLLADAFTPTRPVSVIVPYYEAPAALFRTLAALERQNFPRHLFEVVIVDDGSPTPLEPLRETPLNVTVTRQEDRGFGAARARNVGARKAAHDILVFLDSDMLVEANWLAAHARWHDAVSDAVTVGFRAFVDAGGIDAAAIRNRPGSLRELLSGLQVAPPWVEAQMSRTSELTSRAAG